MPAFRQTSWTVSPLARSRSKSRSKRATSSAVRRFRMGPSLAQCTEGLPFQVDQFLGRRPVSRTLLWHGLPTVSLRRFLSWHGLPVAVVARSPDRVTPPTVRLPAPLPTQCGDALLWHGLPIAFLSRSTI